jgi:type IV pilus assembly protein PilX
MAILNSTVGTHKQSGIALAIALVFLLLMTIIGVSAMSTSALQEKMAGNLKDKHWSFSQAESGITEGERILCEVYPGRIPSIDPGNTTDGLYRTSNTGIPIWETIDWTAGTDVFAHTSWATGYYISEPTRSFVAAPAKFVIEEVQEVRDGLKGSFGYSNSGKSRMLYRVTSRGVGGTANAVTILQTTFAKK